VREGWSIFLEIRGIDPPLPIFREWFGGSSSLCREQKEKLTEIDPNFGKGLRTAQFYDCARRKEISLNELPSIEEIRNNTVRTFTSIVAGILTPDK
jgi:hypothetical protein